MQRGDFTLPNAERHYAPDLQIEPIHLDLYITPDLESQTLDGKIYHRVRINVDGASSLELHAADLEIVNLQVVDNDTKKPLDGNEIDWYYNDKIIDIEFRSMVCRALFFRHIERLTAYPHIKTGYLLLKEREVFSPCYRL